MLNYSFLMNHRGFNKLCIKLGLRTEEMVAILALTQCDVDSVNQICETLDTSYNKSLDIPMIKAMMSVYNNL